MFTLVMSLKITRTKKTSWLLEMVDKELASTNRKNKKLNLLLLFIQNIFPILIG